MIDLLSIQDKPKKKQKKNYFEINAFKVFERIRIRQSYSYKRAKYKYKINPYFTFSHKNENWSVFSREFTTRFYQKILKMFFFINVLLTLYIMDNHLQLFMSKSLHVKPNFTIK